MSGGGPLASLAVLVAVLVAGSGWAVREDPRSARPLGWRRRPVRRRPARAAVPRRAGPGSTPAVLGVAAAAVGVMLAWVVGPVPALLVAGAFLVVPHRIDVRNERRRRRAVERAAPDLIDLLGVAAAAGQTVPTALRTVADRSPPAVREALVGSVGRLDRGATVAEVLRRLSHDLGPLGPPLCEVLGTAHRTGAPVAPALDRLAEVARAQRRRSAEARARRLPVTLLFPLVCCVLPAFGLLAIVPLLAASLADLR
jgi:tight adherence protein C